MAELTLMSDGRRIPVFYAGPETLDKLPALIIIHEIFGVNDHIRDLSRRFALHNMRVFAPDLFAAASTYPSAAADRDDLKTMREVWMAIPDSQLITDLQSVFNLIETRDDILPQCVSAIGYCMGGAIAFMFGCSEPRLSCVVDYYGRIKYGATTDCKPKHPLEYAINLKCPLLCLFAGKDDLITAADRLELSGILEQTDKTYKMKVYEDAEHAFFNDQRPHFNKDASADAWRMTLEFLSQH